MLRSEMSDSEVDVQVARAAERFFGTAGTTSERGSGGDPGDDEAQERMIETLNVAFVQVRYNAVHVSVF
jgi:hypothetical protein